MDMMTDIRQEIDRSIWAFGEIKQPYEDTEEALIAASKAFEDIEGIIEEFERENKELNEKIEELEGAICDCNETVTDLIERNSELQASENRMKNGHKIKLVVAFVLGAALTVGISLI